MSAMEEWAALGEKGQYRLLISCICKNARWHGLRVDPLAHIGEAYCRTVDRLAADTGDALDHIALLAANATLAKYSRDERKAAAASDFEIQGADGDGLGTVLDLIAGAGSVENEAVTRVDFSRFYARLDGKNKRIVDGLGIGKTQAEIAEECDVTQAAISKRLHKMRAALAAEGVGV